jgi:NADH:ubiquinone oxidoreductase subunit 2 (subunit N)
VLALLQTNVVRLLAYSTVAQAGFFLLPLVGVRGALALPALVVFAAAYAAMNTGAFAIVLHTGRTLADFKRLGTTRIFTGLAMTVFLFSLVGIPPLAGFTGKLLLFESAMAAGYTWLAVIAVLNSALALAVYSRIIVAMYFAAPGGPAAPPAPAWEIRTVVMACLLVTLGLTLMAQTFF